MTNNNRHSKLLLSSDPRGFTLIETLVAITILLIAIVGPMSAIGNSLSQIALARDQMIAINLAQEGIEAVRQERDSKMIDQLLGGSNSPVYWRSGLNQGEYIGTMVSPNLITRCGGSCSVDQKKIFQSNATGRHHQFLGAVPNGYTATQFSRVIDVGAGNAEMQVSATVTWTARGALQTIEVKEALFAISAP